MVDTAAKRRQSIEDSRTYNVVRTRKGDRGPRVLPSLRFDTAGRGGPTAAQLTLRHTDGLTQLQTV